MSRSPSPADGRFVRRRLLAAGTAALTSLLAGCTAASPFGSDSGPPCSLDHELVGDDRVTHIEDRYAYDSLSDPARAVFEGALEADGTIYRVPDAEIDAPEEFRYADEVTRYEIAYRGERYVLETWTGEGCSVG